MTQPASKIAVSAPTQNRPVGRPIMPVAIGISANAPPHIHRKSATGLRIADAVNASADWYRCD